MIFAAGRGERLKPFTDLNPKPLCPIHGLPLIEHHILNLAQAGFKQIIINHAYLGGKIRQYLGNGQRFNIDIHYAAEPPGALETGGAIINALPLLGKEPFVTVNSDIFTDYNFKTLQLPETSQAHLVLTHKPNYSNHGDFGLINTKQLCNENRQYTFTGIACYRPELFSTYKPGRYSVTPILRQLASIHQASGELYTGRWFDIGSLERLAIAQR